MAAKVLTLSYKTYSVIFVLICFLVLVFINEFVIFSFYTIFIIVFVNENHTGLTPKLSLKPQTNFLTS